MPKEESESNAGNEIENIKEENLKNGKTLATLTQDILMDHSMK